MLCASIWVQQKKGKLLFTTHTPTNNNNYTFCRLHPVHKHYYLRELEQIFHVAMDLVLSTNKHTPTYSDKQILSLFNLIFAKSFLVY